MPYASMRVTIIPKDCAKMWGQALIGTIGCITGETPGRSTEDS